MDLNADVGEGFGVWTMGNDAQLMPLLTSANIACGGHAGDAQTMWKTVALAKAQGVTIGAHISYPDLRGFGRRPYTGPQAEVIAEGIAQIGALQAICRAQAVEVEYIKPHGSLYHDVGFDVATWGPTLVTVLQAVGLKALMLQASTPGARWFAARGLRVIAEGYVDRAYQDDGHLVPRGLVGAVFDDAGQALAQGLELARHQRVRTRSGRWTDVVAESLCVHGDTPAAVAMAQAVRDGLAQQGIAVQSWRHARA